MSSLSQEMKKELQIFFNSESFLGLGLLPLILKYEKYTDIEEFLDYFTKSVSAREFVKSFFDNGYQDYSDVDINDINTPQDVINLLKKSSFTEEEKWKLLYFVNDSENTKVRLLNLIKSFYNDHFLPHAYHIKSTKQKSVEDMFNLLRDMDLDKLKSCFSVKGHLLEEYKRIIIVPSYFYGVSMTSSSIGDETLLLICGIDMPKLASTEEDEEYCIEALKDLCDDKRIKIIQYLNQNSYYGFEIVQMLNLSNSTTSHHLGLLSRYGIINSIRQENKVYYEVDKDRIKEILHKIESMLT
jgi:DNA-binding transcriptional ArsR family regulator